MEDHIGARDQRQRAGGHQPGGTGAGAGPVDDSRPGRSSRLRGRQDLAGAGGQHPLGEGVAERRRLVRIALHAVAPPESPSGEPA